MFTEALKAVGEALGIIGTVTKAKNAPDVKAAAKGASEQAEVDKETKAVVEGDEETIRKNLS